MLRCRISDTNHIHNFFLLVPQFMLFFVFHGHLVISLIKRRGARGVRGEGRAGVRVEFLMLLLVKFWSVHLYRPTCRIICSGGAAPITTTEMKPRTIVFGWEKKYFIQRVCCTHSNEKRQILLSRKHVCFTFGVLGSDNGLKVGHPD